MADTMKPRLNPGPVAWQRAIAKLGKLWCVSMHDSPMWPIHGRYQCRTCGRHYPVPWVADRVSQPTLIVAVDARLAGRAELTIQERPYTAPDVGPALSVAGR